MVQFTAIRTFTHGTMATAMIGLSALALSACGDTGATGAPGATGVTGATGPAGPGVTWVDVTTASIQADSNFGYLADSSSQVTIKLPTNPSVGDLVEVTGPGGGGWKIAQNAAQQVYAGFENARWTPTGPSQSSTLLAASGDGTHRAAAALNGPIYTSTDSGVTWAAQNSGSSTGWEALAWSADGTCLLAAADNGPLQLSQDAGVTWTAVGPTLQDWETVSVSPHCTDQMANGYNSNTGSYQTYVSTDKGDTWALATTQGANVNSSVWPTQAQLIVVGSPTGTDGVWVSADFGNTWTVVPGTSNDNYNSVAASSGGKVIIVVGYQGFIISRDSGATWAVTPGSAYTNVAISPDGTALIAADFDFQSSTSSSVSTDGGTTWTQLSAGPENFSRFLAFDDQFVAVGINGNGLMYSLAAATTVGTAGYVSGEQHQSVTLQYSGDGLFSVIDNEGFLTVQ